MSDQIKRSIEEGKLRFPLSDPAWRQYPAAYKRAVEEMRLQLRGAGLEVPADFFDGVEKAVSDLEKNWMALMNRFEQLKENWEG